jgi:hypothetical protein
LGRIKGKHNLKDRTIIYATSQLIAAYGCPLKHITKEERPDGSNYNLFHQGILLHFHLRSFYIENIETPIFG